MIELGANDGLRGLPVASMKRNLTEIITRAKARGITVVLTGMEAPPNYGAAYTAEFRQVYRDLAKAHDVTFMPVLSRRRRGHPEPEHRRRHASERRGLAHHRARGVARARAAARESAVRPDAAK